MSIIDEKKLMDNFYNKDKKAFVEVYNSLYKQLCYFASSIYHQTDIDAEDIVHDIFISIWTSKNQHFATIENLKAYLYTCIKNRFKNYLQHNNHIRKYEKEMIFDEDFFSTKIIETETYSIISEALDILPEECAKVFKLTIDGWNVDEIAEKLGKAKSTVYEHKQKAIKMVKQKLLSFMIIYFN